MPSKEHNPPEFSPVETARREQMLLLVETYMEEIIHCVYRWLDAYLDRREMSGPAAAAGVGEQSLSLIAAFHALADPGAQQATQEALVNVREWKKTGTYKYPPMAARELLWATIPACEMETACEVVGCKKLVYLKLRDQAYGERMHKVPHVPAKEAVEDMLAAGTDLLDTVAAVSGVEDAAAEKAYGRVLGKQTL